ncbi:hypothetical protein ACNJUL_20970, partial [Mycobacterium tuberculosis]
MNRKCRFTAVLVPAFTMLAAAPAVAQDTSPETDAIVVTAQKREQNIQDVPLAITALGGNALAQRGTMDSDTLASAVPGL